MTNVTPIGAEIERGDLLYEIFSVTGGLDFDEDVFDRELSIFAEPGDDLRELEQILVDLDYDPDERIVVDDVFDQATADAVALWEEDLGLEVNGVVEVEQFEAMIIEGDASDPLPVVAMYGDEQLTRQLWTFSSPGSDIRVLEENLVALGYDPDGEIEIDDIFDEATEEAVERWETDLGVEVNGTVELGRFVVRDDGRAWRIFAGEDPTCPLPDRKSHSASSPRPDAYQRYGFTGTS